MATNSKEFANGGVATRSQANSRERIFRGAEEISTFLPGDHRVGEISPLPLKVTRSNRSSMS
jgi:hypothetical protein